MTQIDDDIIRRVQAGERSEFMELFDRYYAQVERFARRQMQDAESAKDVASETFLRAFRNVDSFRVGDGVSYLGYLLMICRRIAISERSRLRNAPMFLNDLSDGGAELLPDGGEPPFENLLRGERSTHIHDALNQLVEEDREIIHLAFERDLSRKDIMVIMEKPSVSAVTSHLYRALQKLKTIAIRQGYFAV